VTIVLEAKHKSHHFGETTAPPKEQLTRRQTSANLNKNNNYFKGMKTSMGMKTNNNYIKGKC
jgi:hypothetical protein